MLGLEHLNNNWVSTRVKMTGVTLQGTKVVGRRDTTVIVLPVYTQHKEERHEDRKTFLAHIQHHHQHTRRYMDPCLKESRCMVTHM